METIKLKLENTFGFISEATVHDFKRLAVEANQALHEKTGAGNAFLGWVDLPNQIDEALLADIEQTARNLKEKAEIVVTIGIGGSYLGAKAIIEGLSHTYSQLRRDREYPLVLFAGNKISEEFVWDIEDILKDRDFALIVISKSGTTTEPAIGFRLLKNDLEQRYGKDGARERIVAITDESKGALRTMAEQEGYKTFVIPDDVGGRFSVLTPVGLLPIATAGFDIRALVAGARDMAAATTPEVPFEQNLACLYAATRNALYDRGKRIEILVNYNPKLQYMAEWWKQLYGESEGKEQKGIYPSSANFTTDLHSLGQYIQDGLRNLFETIITIAEPNRQVLIPHDDQDLDKLNFLAGQRVDFVNKMAELGTLIAHTDGGVPNIVLEMPRLDAYYLGQVIYFFEKACGISGYILGINPFDQPGVEDYKNNMFALLGKPGFEEATAKIRQRVV